MESLLDHYQYERPEEAVSVDTLSTLSHGGHSVVHDSNDHHPSQAQSSRNASLNSHTVAPPHTARDSPSGADRNSPSVDKVSSNTTPQSSTHTVAQDTPSSTQISPQVHRRNRSAQSVAPSDPAFDRTLITDADYIELLIFESKELRALLEKREAELKKRELDIRQHDVKIRQQDIQIKKAEIEIQERDVEIRDLELELKKRNSSAPCTPVATHFEEISNISSNNSSDTAAAPPPIPSKTTVAVGPTSPVSPISSPSSRSLAGRSPSVRSLRSPTSDLPPLPVSPSLHIPVEVPVRSSRRGHIQTEAQNSIYTNISNFAPNANTSTSHITHTVASNSASPNRPNVNSAPAASNSTPINSPPMSKSNSINSNLSRDGKVNHVSVNTSIATFTTADDSVDSIDSHLERVKSNASSDIRTVRSHENRNTSNSSFSSYKSRIKLPASMQHRDLSSGSSAMASSAALNGNAASGNPGGSLPYSPALAGAGFASSPASVSTSTFVSTSTDATLMAASASSEFLGLKSPAVLDFDSHYETPTPQSSTQYNPNDSRRIPRTPEAFNTRFPRTDLSPQSTQSQSTQSTQSTHNAQTLLNVQNASQNQSTASSHQGSASNQSLAAVQTMHNAQYPSSMRSPHLAIHEDVLRTPVNSVYSDSLRNNATPGSSFNVLSSSRPEEEEALFVKPEDFQTISITIISTIHVSAQHQNKRSDDPNCTIAITDRESQKEMWRVRKTYSQLIAFDNEIRPIVEYFGLPNIPEKALFLSTIPTKIEARRVALQNYFNSIFVMPHIPHMVLHRTCRYLSLDFINPLDDFKSGARKEGFLVRRYKALGTNWKVRWCQLDGSVLEVYENPGGAFLEQIRLKGTQIGRQSSDSVAEDKGYRHAFLIMETHKQSKLSASFPKHFFCAETDDERDDWVEVLLQYNGANSGATANTPLANSASSASYANSGANESFTSGSPTSRYEYEDEVDQNTKMLSIENPIGAQDETKKKKRSLFPFRSKVMGTQSHASPAEQSLEEKLQAALPTAVDGSMQQYLSKMNLDEDLTKTIFGREVAEAYALSHHPFNGMEIPSVCFRCLDYLTKTGAVYEEGIFRLSGSASTIRQLKEQFNIHFDLDLFESPLRPDIHTVAGLFKSYLRELPCPILGGAAYNHLNNVVLHNQRPASQLALTFRDYFNDSANVDVIHYDVCRVLFSFLREVIAHSANNRMTLRNLCIVFVPTLNVSLEVLSTLLVDYDCIFENGEPVPDNEREVLDLHIPTF